MTHTSSLMASSRKLSAVDRRAARLSRSHEEQLEVLAGRPGSSRKEVARLKRLIARGATQKAPSKAGSDDKPKKKNKGNPKGKKKEKKA